MEVTSDMRYGQSESTALTTYSENWLAAQTEYPLTEKQLDAELALLATAFPTVVRGYDAAEHSAMKTLWHGIFRTVPQEILREAITRFIINDRKGFFPAPGQIVGCIEQIIAERKSEKMMADSERHWAKVRENQRRIDAGENCSTCRFCDHRKEPPGTYEPNYEAYRRADFHGDREKYLVEKLYCQNPESYKYEGEFGSGTAASILCELYEPQPKIELLTTGEPEKRTEEIEQ